MKPTAPSNWQYRALNCPEWALIAPYLTLLPEDAKQREYPLRKAFNGLRYIIKTGGQWRAMPHDLPPWAAVYQQAALAGGAVAPDGAASLDSVHEAPAPWHRSD